MSHTRFLLTTQAAFLVFAALTTVSQQIMANDDFPLRNEYKDVPIINGPDLRKNLENVSVIDVRSDFEFHILHIQGAINIPVSDAKFPKLIKEIRQVTGKPLVFYCNGHTCRKSYMAGRHAQHAGLKDSRTYDAGIATWAHENPELTDLLNSPLTSAERLISKEDFEKHLLSPKDFIDRVSSSIVIDVRTPLEKAGLSLFVGREKSVPLEKRKKLGRYIQKALDQDLPLLAYDASGQEVPWLQYYLEERGVRDFWFMRGGAKAFFDYLQNTP